MFSFNATVYATELRGILNYLLSIGSILINSLERKIRYLKLCITKSWKRPILQPLFMSNIKPRVTMLDGSKIKGGINTFFILTFVTPNLPF